MKKRKKFLAFLLAGATVFALGACSGNTSPPPTKTETNVQDTKEETKDAPKEEQDTGNASGKAASEDGPIIIGFLGWSSGADAM